MCQIDRGMCQENISLYTRSSAKIPDVHPGGGCINFLSQGIVVLSGQLLPSRMLVLDMMKSIKLPPIAYALLVAHIIFFTIVGSFAIARLTYS